MSYPTVQDAINDICEPVNQWCADNGYTVKHENVKVKHPSKDPFVAVYITHDDDGQSSLACVDGIRKFTAMGQLLMQVHSSIDTQNGVAYPQAESLRNLYRRPNVPGSVWYRRARLNPIGTLGMFHVVNVLVDFEYNQHM